MSQKLQVELKNVPVGASQAHCSTSLQLNRGQSLSVADDLQNSKLTCNNPEVNLRQHKGGSDLRVLNIVYADRGAKAPLSFSKKNLKKGVS